MEIIWSNEALQNYYKVIDYLIDNWSKEVLVNFENDTENLLDRLSSHSEICPQSKINGYRKCIINKHNSLVYSTINNYLYIVTFIDNRSNHSF